MTRPLGKKKPGTYETSVSVAPLNQGMYFIVLAKDDVLVCSRKILKAD